MTAPRSLRDLLEDLERDGDLVRIADEVDPDYEIAAICRVASDAGSPALYFERVKGSTMPVVANVFGTRRRIARALGHDEASLLEGVSRTLDAPPRTIDAPGSAAPHVDRRIVLRGDEVDLERLPVPLWNVGDGGRFVTAGVVIASGADAPNAAIYRMQVHDRRTLGVYMAPDHHVRRLLEDPDRREPVEVSVALGAPPTLFVAASSDFDVTRSELEVAARFGPLPLARGLDVDLPWPVETEVVLEGFLDGELRGEGPFVEFTGYQSGAGPSPVVHVTAMHYRPDAIYHAAYVARPPNETASVWRELEDAMVLRTLQQRYPIVTAVHRPADIGRDFFAVIQIERTRAKPGMVRNLLAGAAYCLPRPKYVVVVDTDIDVYRLEDVLWAMCMRVHPERDVVVVAETMTSPLDPRGPHPPLTAKMLIDATTKPDAPGVISAPPDAALVRAQQLFRQARQRMSNPLP